MYLTKFLQTGNAIIYEVYTLKNFTADAPMHLPLPLLILPTLPLSWLRTLLARVPAIIPSSCAVCGLRASKVLCEPCRQQFFDIAEVRCGCCALPLVAAATNETADATPTCGACLANPPAFDATFAVADYQAPIDQLVLSLKFGGRLALATLFADLMRDTLLSTGVLYAAQAQLPTRLIPVPLSANRLQHRGFNQSLEIARVLGRHFGVPVLPTSMERVRETRSQAELPLADRRQNVRHAFIVRSGAESHILGQHVGVVDDVMTTGETLQEIALTLKRFGATRVTNFVFARTLPR